LILAAAQCEPTVIEAIRAQLKTYQEQLQNPNDYPAALHQQE